MGFSRTLGYAAALASCCALTPASATNLDPLKTGNGLFETCKGREGTPQALACVSYIAGAADLIPATTEVDGGKRLYCPPAHTTNGQYRDVVVKFLSENPQHRHRPSSSIIISALMIAFPCDD